MNTPLNSVLGYSRLAIGMDEEISKNLFEIIGISQNTMPYESGRPNNAV